MFVNRTNLSFKAKLINWFKSLNATKPSIEERKRLTKEFQKGLLYLHRFMGDREFEEFRQSYEFRMMQDDYTPTNLQHAFQHFRERKSTEGTFFGWI